MLNANWRERKATQDSKSKTLKVWGQETVSTKGSVEIPRFSFVSNTWKFRIAEGQKDFLFRRWLVQELAVRLDGCEPVDTALEIWHQLR